MKYELVRKHQGANPEHWRDVKAMAIPVNQLDTMIADQFGSEHIEFIKQQLAAGRVVQLAWGYLRQHQPPEGK